MSDRYAGPCMGGPIDGEWIAYPSPMMQIVDYRELPIDAGNPDIPIDLSYFTYRWNKCGYWEWVE